MSLLLLFLFGCGDQIEVKHVKIDNDDDGYAQEVDCDDAHATVNPDAAEVCDERDNDCDGEVDENPEDGTQLYADQDHDGVGNPADSVVACDGTEGYVGAVGDCDDEEPSMFPGNPEICDGLDNDCNGEIDDQAVDASLTYGDADGDGYGFEGTGVKACSAPEGQSLLSGDCDDTDSAVHPDAPETNCADPTDYNCDGSVAYEDRDQDGFAACEECDDQNAAVHPDADEICNGIDDDCDGAIDDADDSLTDAPVWYRDPDGDGYTAGTGASLSQCSQPAGYAADAGDCDEYDATVYPGAVEICDAFHVDEDCDGLVDDADPSTDASSYLTWYRDFDGDKYGDGSRPVGQCEAPASYVANADDCDDTAVSVHPGASEICNSVDDDCDGLTDDQDPNVSGATTWYTDHDGDGYGTTTILSCSQPSGAASAGGDCDDTKSTISPGATEVCDSANTDENCDGLAEDATASGRQTYAKDSDGDGYGGSSTASYCDAPSGYVLAIGDCNDSNTAINPSATEVCDASNTDEDCDGLADDADPSVGGTSNAYADADRDGYGSTTVSKVCDIANGYTTVSGDCNDANASVSPAALEVCDSGNVDEDCDGLADDLDASALGKTTSYRDADHDGQGIASSSISSCDLLTGYALSTGDCDDSRATIYYGATEICDSYDNDCDGSVDEGVNQTWYRDIDGDGYGTTSSTVFGCQTSGYAATSSDCNDGNATINPSATEVCGDGVDNNCDGSGC